MAGRKGREVLFRQLKETNRRPQSPAMFGVGWMFEILFEMHERTRGLDQALKKIVVRGVIIEPKLFQNIVRLIIMLFVPALKIGPIKRVLGDLARKSPENIRSRQIGIFAFELAHEA